MRKRTHRIAINFILICGLAAALIGSEGLPSLTAEATSIGEVEGQINQHSNQLEEANNKIVALETEQEILQEQIDDLNAEIVNTMASIGVMEEQLAAKESELAAKVGEIAAKEEEIAQKAIQIQQTEAEYEAAVKREEDQRENMAICARLMYERGEDSILDALLEGKGLSDVLNQMDRVEKVYEYENNVLTEYIQVKNQVHDLWDRLVAEKESLETDKVQLEADRGQLETDKQALVADRAELESQKSNLTGLLAKKKRESANYDDEIKKARKDAAAAKRLLQQDQERLRQLQAQNNGGGSGGTTPANASNTTSYTSTINNASGSDLGKKIANFACQYIGNPYVMGGTSLTGGADCSGFTYRVYSEFGYTLPRTSYQQRNAGTGVSYENAQPGDIICYDGHVAIYIGGGLIVHASNSSPYPAGGIKISQAGYRAILSVRRIVN